MAKIFRAIGLVVLFCTTISLLNYKGINTFNKIDIINSIMIKPSIKNLTYLYVNDKPKTSSVQYIVVHHDAITGKGNHFAAINKIHIAENGWSGISYHYTIDKTGVISQFHADDAFTAHVEGHNHYSIAVCVEGNFDKEKLNKHNYQALIKLLIFLKEKYPSAEIIGHGELNNTSCPGESISVESIRFLVKNTKHFAQL